MEALTQSNNITSRVIKTEMIDWRNLSFIQQDKFKDIPEEAKAKLKFSILNNNFMQPFYVWRDEHEKLWCLDGKHRSIILLELIEEGWMVPHLLPATFIQCDNKKEASKLVLLFSSQYAKVTQEGLFKFITLNDLDFSELKSEIDLPEFSELKFEQKYELDALDEVVEEPIDIDSMDIIVKPGDIFMLNNHTLYCGDFMSKDIAGIFNGVQARIVFTDPPYNLKTDAFSNNGSVNHEDFAMAAGEMSDEEFVEFIRKVMAASNTYSINGAIHYICMDWRHVWHMSEASNKVHGSVEPKNLIVWNKNNAGMGSFYRSKHEFIFVYKNGDGEHVSNVNLGDRYRSNVWEYPISTSFNNEDKGELKNHPTPKPVKMVVDAILDSTNEGEIVVDWFMGSGTTLIAAEITSRICYGCEILPKYIQSEILRYIKHCDVNNKPVEITHLNGPLTTYMFRILLEN